MYVGTYDYGYLPAPKTLGGGVSPGGRAGGGGSIFDVFGIWDELDEVLGVIPVIYERPLIKANGVPELSTSPFD